MLYYYNRDGRFQKESSKEYKTEKGAVEYLNKEGQGAVFDETGKMIISLVEDGEVPERALDTNADGSIPVFNEDNEQVGTVDAETVAKATEKFWAESEEQLEGETQEHKQTDRTHFDVQTTCDSLRIRSGAGKDYRIVGYIKEKVGNKKNHTIVKEKNGWGKLASGEGWIELAFSKKVS